MKKISFDIPEVDMDDRGVSPVIGVILMVAITVILAAVIASFVLGFGDSVSENVQAGASIDASPEPQTGEVTVTWISEGNAESLDVNVSSHSGISDSENPVIELGSVGESGTISESVSEDSETTFTVNVIAEGSGGSRTVVASKEVTI